MAEGTDLTREIGDPSDDRSTEAIRRDIAARRDSISETVDQLSDRVHAALDWRTYVAEHPFVAIGVTAGIACTVASFVGRRRAPQDRIMDALADGVEDLAGRFREGLDTLPLVRKARIGRLLWSLASTAAAAAITNVVKRGVSGTEPEFKERRDPEPPRSVAARASSSSESD